MKSFYINHTNFKTYHVYLNEHTGATEAVRVKMISKGGKGTERLLWQAGQPYTNAVRSVTANPQFPEYVAQCMGW